MKSFDVAIIGAGPGGYVAAIRCAQLGFNTALIEKNSTLGGTCLNVGCIPSKALLHSSELYHEAKHNFATHGIDLKDLSCNFKQMMQRKEEVVEKTTQGIAYLMQKNKIQVFHASASFIDKNTLSLTDENNATSQIKSKYIIIATGSVPVELPFAPFAKKRILDSTKALSLSKIPESLAIIGGGVIGLELGSVYARLGTKVTVIEYLNRLVPSMDKELITKLKKSLQKLDIKFYLQSKVTEVKAGMKNVELKIKKQGKEEALIADYVLVSVGRKALFDSLNLANANIELENNFIKTNDKLQTSTDNIFAIGDVIGGAMLAHKAEEEGVFVAEVIAQEKPEMHYDYIPSVIYTNPEAASVGKTEEQLKEANIAYNVGKFPFSASGKARASLATDGFIKVLADKTTDEILGIHMLGARSSDMIAQAVTAMYYKASSEDIARMIHAHPTFSEALKEACLNVSNNALHI